MKAETSRHLFNSRNNGEAFIAWSIRQQLQLQIKIMADDMNADVEVQVQQAEKMQSGVSIEAFKADEGKTATDLFSLN